MKTKIEGWDHFNGGHWEFTVNIPAGWRMLEGVTKSQAGDMCAEVIVPKKPLKFGKTNVLNGRFQLIEKANIGIPACLFKGIIRKMK